MWHSIMWHVPHIIYLYGPIVGRWQVVHRIILWGGF